MDFQFQPGSSSMFARNVGSGMEERGDEEETKVYGGRGAGGKLRSSRRSSIKKTTPYDRPTSGRHSTAGGLPAPSVSAHSSSSLASRLVGSASRLIASSASYFFPSLFGRKTLALTNDNPTPDRSYAGQCSSNIMSDNAPATLCRTMLQQDMYAECGAFLKFSLEHIFHNYRLFLVTATSARNCTLSKCSVSMRTQILTSSFGPNEDSN